jgi:hypothetical protein
MKKFLFLVAIICLSGTLTVKAQKKKLADSSTVIIFTNNSVHKKKKKAAGESNIIKISPLGLASGTFPITYERKITDFFSMQGSAGITMRNYARGLFIHKKDGIEENGIKYHYPWADENAYDISEPIYGFDFRKAKMGYMASLQPRIYFGSEGLDGGFLGLSFDYYRYNFQIPGMVSTGPYSSTQTGDIKKEYENIMDYMVHFGTQVLYDRMSLEYSLAVGMRNVSGSKYVAAYDEIGQLQEGMATYKQTLFNFNMAFRVGYHF